MKKFILLALLLNLSLCGAASVDELSKQATAFYSDNNRIKTLDLILQINEKERSSKDWILLGNVLADNGKIEDAAYMYQKAIDNDKKCYKAYYNLGNYYMGKGQFDKAISNYKKASKIKTDNPYIFYNLGCAYLKIEDYKKARESFNKAIMYNANVPEFHYNLAYTYKKLNKQKVAETYLQNYNKMTSEL